MHRTLIVTTQYLLCATSMALTALFAASFADVRPDESTWMAMIRVGLLVAVGVGLDLSKYLLWRYRTHAPGLRGLSVALVAFSWCASVSYFAVRDHERAEHQRTTSAEYDAYRARLDAVRTEIQHQERLIHNQLASRYHEQWEKGQANTERLHALHQKLHSLQDLEPTVAKTRQHDASLSGFFYRLSQRLHLPIAWVSLSAYAALALLIELVSLGMMSLQAQSSPVPKSERTHPETPKDPVPSTTDQIRDDILAGITPPTARHIIAHYKLRHAEVKVLLSDLYQEGRLIKDRNTYALPKLDLHGSDQSRETSR